MRVFWISTTKMTVCIDVDAKDTVSAAPPIVRKFVGQPARNLFVWMRQQPGFRWVEITDLVFTKGVSRCPIMLP